MGTDRALPRQAAVLVLPRIRVQNANAISSPLTWGFPAITAFTGLMKALARRLGRDSGIAFHGVGVICHGFEAQVTTSRYTRAFHLTRNPVLVDGSTASIVEEGRAHLDVTLVFDVRIADAHRGELERNSLAERVAHQLAGMRIAGGSVMPALPGAQRRPAPPVLELVPDEGHDGARRKQFRRLARRWLPGFALVSRDDLLQARLAELRASDPSTTSLEAWLDLSRMNSRAVALPATCGGGSSSTIEWIHDPCAGWVVPIPVGFSALSGLHTAGSVSGARDMTTPFRFVEPVWSVGQWISPHRLLGIRDLVWFAHHDPKHPTEHGLYRCRNGHTLAMPADTPQQQAS